MVLGALLDAGLPLDRLCAELGRLSLAGYTLSARPERRGVIAGTRAIVTVEGGPAERRGLGDILGLIEASALSPSVKERSALIFERLAAAESRVHGVPAGEVHFHEVGAVDAIVDIVGSVVGLELLGVEALFSSPLPSGSGTVSMEHGTIPVPAPATLELMASAGAPVRPTPSPDVGELVTPTGAAIVTTVATFESPTFLLERIGYGVGSRDIASHPNVLPLWLGEREEAERELLLLETNIDDMSAELLGYVMERLFQRGALDVWFTPIQMKKNRPATQLSAIVPRAVRGEVVATMMRETSTMGVRVQPIERHESQREQVTFDSSLGPVVVKLKVLEGVRVGLYPEFEECARLAREHGLPLQAVYRIVVAEAGARLL